MCALYMRIVYVCFSALVNHKRHGSNVVHKYKRATWFPSTPTFNLTWLLLTLCSSCYSLHPFTLRPRVRTVTKPALGEHLIPSIPPLFPDWTKTKGTIVRKQLPEQTQVSFSSGSKLIPLWLGNQRGGKVGHLWKHRDQFWAGTWWKCQAPTAKLFGFQLLDVSVITNWLLKIISPSKLKYWTKLVMKTFLNWIYETNTETVKITSAF